MKKIAAIILTAIIAVSALSLAASAYAMPFMNWKMFGTSGPGNGIGMGPGYRLNTAIQQSFARLDGFINQSGSANVKGAIEAQARTILLNSTTARQGASATAIWTSNQSRPISGLKDKQNFTYTFDTARLVNVSTASLNTTGYSFFLNGTWNVYQITTNFTIVTDSSGNVVSFNRNQNAVALATNAYGELKVASNANNFTLSITGIDALTGLVHVQRITTKMFNPFRINNDDSTTIVTKADVSTIVNSYGSSPGWGNYDQRMDYNFNYKIDITDLTTAAANINV